MRFRFGAYLVAIGLFGVSVLLWEYLVRVDVVPSIIVPAPSDVAESLIRFFTINFGYFQEHLRATVVATLLGFGIGSSIAFFLAVSLGISPFLRRVFSSYIVGFQTLPKVALAPIFVTWFGFGATSKVVMSIVICFFPVFVDTLTGLGLVEERALQLMRTLGASRFQVLRKLALPTALPNIFAGLKTGVTLALVGVVVGELVGTRAGIGHLLKLYSFQLQVDNVFALIVVLGFIGWALYTIIDHIERRVVFWHQTAVWEGN